MADLNKQQIIGRLGRDPEIRSLSNGQTVAVLSVATSEKYKDKTGEWQEKTEWHRVNCWRHMAEQAEKYCRKGFRVYVEGKTETRVWTDKEGNEVKTKEIVCTKLIPLDYPPKDGAYNPADTSSSSSEPDDDLPF